MTSTVQCKICSTVRGLSEHLTELSLAAEFLGNSSRYTSEHGTVTIRTHGIGKWLNLAGKLEKVEIDAWKFETGDSDYCEPIADSIRAHTEHYTEHATALTRFMFVCNALEESYRFIDHLYGPWATINNVGKPSRKRTSSLRASALIDDLLNRKTAVVEPRNFGHLTGVFIQLFDRYTSSHRAEVRGIEPGCENKKIYALHLVRNLRNHVAHGTFPIGVPYDYGGYEDSDDLKQLLNHACRVASLYIQILFRGFSPGFESEDYRSIQNACGEEYGKFIKRCDMTYLNELHMKSDFALHQGIYSD